MKKIYFGHPINFYNTPKESQLIQIIRMQFPNSLIENPNQPHHSENYQKWKKERGNGMLYYYEKVLPFCDKGVFLSFEDGMFGYGVFGEAEFMNNAGKTIYEISLDGKIKIMAIDFSRLLSIEETRKRVYK